MPLPLLFLLLATAPQPAVRRHVENGYALAEKGDIKAAEAELREAVKLAPEDPVALAVLGTVLSRTPRLEEANRYLERALQLDPAEANTRYNLAFNQFRLGQTGAARKNLERILKQKPAHKEAAALLAAIGVKSGYDEALGQYRAGRFAESEALLERLSSSGPPDPQVMRLLAWCLEKQNRPEAALKTMRQAIELAPADPTLYESAAQILIEQRNFAAASGAVSRALELAPASVQALKLKGQIDSERGDLKGALETYRKAAELDRSDPETLEGLGRAQRLLLRYKEAAATFDRALVRFPANARLYDAYAELLLDPGTQPDAAAESRAAGLLEKALKLDPSLAQAHYKLGKLLREEGKTAQALPHLEAAATLNPADSATHLELAGVYRELGRPADQGRELARYRESVKAR